MLRTHQLLWAGLLIALLLPSTVYWPSARSAGQQPALPAGPYTVQGQRILDVRGRPYAFHGVARDGLEFACQGDPYLTPRYLALLGPPVPGVSGTFWYSNTVRLPLSEAFWLHGEPHQHCTPQSYQILVRTTIDTLLLLHLNVIIDLQWTDAGGQSSGGTWQLPDEDSVLFWRQLATLYGKYPEVLFELYNEPHPYPATGDPWGCWRSGCQVSNDDSNDFSCGCRLSLSYHAVGMQTLVDTVRQQGARNLVLVGGLNWGYDLSNLPQYALSGSNIVYDTHPYPYQGKRTSDDWETGFGRISATYAVISAESGEYDCQASFVQRLIPYLDARHISWIGWAWYAQGSACSFPQLISDYTGTPEPALGLYIYQRLLRSAGRIPRTSFPPVGPDGGPAARQWYFPSEPVGEGFSQVLVLATAATRDCPVTVQYILQQARGSQLQLANKTVTLHIRAAGRVTLQVNRDVGVPVSASAILVAAIARVSGSDCPGIVAERAVHLNSGQLLTGSALSGFTQTGTMFFFADVPTGVSKTVASALSLLNPGPEPARVTVRYLAAGRQVGMQQSVLQAGSGGQFRVPADLPAHVAAVLVADHPVVALRVSLMHALAVQGLGAVSGLTEVSGVPQAASAWFFAEGSTGPGFQERLIVTNLSESKRAHLTITLQYANGQRQIQHAEVLPGAQSTWNINVRATSPAGATPEVALEVTSDLAVLAERVLFFRFWLAGGLISGVTDIPGLAHPSTVSVFADGYSAPGFAEWLSLQNVSGQRELLTLTLLRAGRAINYQCYLPPYGRGTISIDRLMHQLDHAGPGNAEISLIVHSDGGAFVAERPMYWNIAGSQGGSDVLGYTGES
jgi:endoglucanase